MTDGLSGSGAYYVWARDEAYGEDSGTRDVPHGERESVKVLARWRRKESR
jgi:hypothetical protein